jgi:hypothetical protein
MEKISDPIDNKGKHALLDTNVLADLVLYVLQGMPIEYLPQRRLKRLQSQSRMKARTILDKVTFQYRPYVIYEFTRRMCQGSKCFISELTLLELPKVSLKWFLDGKAQFKSKKNSFLNAINETINEWLSLLKDLFGIEILGVSYKDHDVAVNMARACQQRSDILNNAVDIYLLAIALNGHYSFVTMDRRLVCGLSGSFISGLRLYTETVGNINRFGFGVCIADARFDTGNRELNTSIYLVDNQCMPPKPNLNCGQKWCQ